MSDRTWIAAQMAVLLSAFAAVPVLGAIIGWPLERPTMASGLAGGVVIAAGLAVIWAAAHSLGKQMTPRPTPVVGGELVETGIFGRVRHPVYLGLLLLVLGWWIIWLSPPAFAAVVGAAVFFDAKSAHEEKLLTARYPGYRDYASRVRHRMIPGLI